MTYLILLALTVAWIWHQRQRRIEAAAREKAEQVARERYFIGPPIAPFSGGLRNTKF